jgi:hypothetical protein
LRKKIQFVCPKNGKNFSKNITGSVNSEHPKKDLAFIGNKFEETCQKLVKNHRPKNSKKKKRKVSKHGKTTIQFFFS